MTPTPCDVAAAIAHNRTHQPTPRPDRPTVWTTTTPENTVTDPDPAGAADSTGASDTTARECVSCHEPFTVKAGQTLTLCPKCRRAPYDELIRRAERGPQATITVDRYGRLVVDSAEQRADRRGPNR